MKKLRKFALLAVATLAVSGSLTSCATVFGGKVVESQKHRPAPGEPRREIRVGALIADILLFPLVSLPVDFATGAIYKPKAVAQQNAPVQKKALAESTKK
jgi:predicted small secreted protein